MRIFQVHKRIPGYEEGQLLVEDEVSVNRLSNLLNRLFISETTIPITVEVFGKYVAEKRIREAQMSAGI